MKNLRNAFLITMLLAAVPALHATEGVDQYPNGAENWQSAHLPPAGFYLVNYSFYYAGQLRDATGGKASPGGSTPSVSALADGMRAVWMTGKKPLNADFGMCAVFAAVDQNVNLNGSRSTKGMADIALDPLVLSWHTANWHLATAMEVLAPTGRFDKNDPRLTLGTNYWSYQPIFGFTYLPKSGWEASAKFMYNVNTANPSTHYKSGQDFHVDYLAGKHVGRWALGASGYVYKQFTPDTSAGQTVAAVPGMFSSGREGQALAVGPSVRYESKSHVGFIAQWNHETLVKNRFGGDKLLFKMIVPMTWARGFRL